MASDELKEMRKNLTKEAVRDHQMATTGGTQTDLFTCGKCKGKCCTYTQVCIKDIYHHFCTRNYIMDFFFHGAVFVPSRFKLAALMSQ